MNAQPTATIDSISPTSTNEGEEISFRGTGSDDDGTISYYEWSSDVDGVFSDKEDPDYSSLTADDHQISFRVKDDDNYWSDSVTYSTRLQNKIGSDK